MSEVKVHSSCRACGGDIIGVFDLGSHWPSEFPAEKGSHARPRVPLNLIRCHACGLIQLEHTVPPEWMFKVHYYYHSGINEAMVQALDDVVWAAIAAVPLHSKMAVLDIGANDGTLLSLYKKRLGGGCPVRSAYEPAPNMQEALKAHAEVVIPDFFPISRDPEFRPFLPWSFRAITSIACFYSNPDPSAFAAEVKRLLHPEGVWINQLAYLPRILDNAAFDGICFTPGELIITEDGLKPIETIQRGEKVLTSRGRYREVLATMEREYSGDLIKLQAYGFGHLIQVTPEHPIKVRRGGAWKWKPARNIRKGDIVCRPVAYETVERDYVVFDTNHCRSGPGTDRLPVNHALMEVAGYYLSEGFASQAASFSFGLSAKEVLLANHCADKIRELGFKAHIRPKPTSTLVTSTPTLARFLAKNFGKGAAKKRIPLWAMQLPVPLQRTLLRAYMEGDGYRYRDDKYWRACTVSQQLAYDLSLLANRIGYKASINKMKRKLGGSIRGRLLKTQLPLWDVLIHTAPVKNEKTWLETNAPNEAYHAQSILGRQCARIRVKEVVKDYKGSVYNLEVREDNTYVAAGMTVHNCHEHVTYWSLSAMLHLLRRHALEVYDCEEVAVNEGSIRLFIAHENARPISPRVEKMLQAEEELHLRDTNEPYLKLRAAAEEIREGILQHVLGVKAQGGDVDLLGASTKGNTLLQFCGLWGQTIRRAIDRSPEKAGRFTVTEIPIVSEEEGRRDPAQLLIALPWSFRDQLIARELGKWPAGTRVLFPMPRMEVVTL